MGRLRSDSAHRDPELAVYIRGGGEETLNWQVRN
jgi:hypothetical protein